MTKEPDIRLTLRLNLHYEKHRQAWAILSEIPNGRRTDFICDVLLEKQEGDNLQELIRQIVRDEMKHYEVKWEEPTKKGDAVDDTVIDFILSLQKGADI